MKKTLNEKSFSKNIIIIFLFPELFYIVKGHFSIFPQKNCKVENSIKPEMKKKCFSKKKIDTPKTISIYFFRPIFF